MKIDLSADDMHILICLIDGEFERGQDAMARQDLRGCAEAMPPRVLRPLKEKLEPARERARWQEMRQRNRGR